jgi:hypothetical protein
VPELQATIGAYTAAEKASLAAVVARIVSEATGNTSPEFQSKLKTLVAAEQRNADTAAATAAAVGGTAGGRSANERFLEGSVHGGRNPSTHGQGRKTPPPPPAGETEAAKPGMSIFTPANA